MGLILTEFISVAFDAANMSVWRFHVCGNARLARIQCILVTVELVSDELAPAQIAIVHLDAKGLSSR